jgi:hypothetical protein
MNERVSSKVAKLARATIGKIKKERRARNVIFIFYKYRRWG